MDFGFWVLEFLERYLQGRHILRTGGEETCGWGREKTGMGDDGPEGLNRAMSKFFMMEILTRSSKV